MNTAGIIALQLKTTFSDEELVRAIDTVSSLVERMQPTFTTVLVTPFCAEFDQDNRELWEIPEAINMFKRAIDCGLYGLLTLPMKWKKQVKLELRKDPMVYSYFISIGRGKLAGEADRMGLANTLGRSCSVWNGRACNQELYDRP